MIEHQKYMQEALKEAEKALKKNEVPVGCIIVCDNKIVARAHNTRQKHQKTTNHAEILALKKANKKLKSWRLDECSIYVTLEPCLMCAGAIIQARINSLYYALDDEKSGAFGGLINLEKQGVINKLKITRGILEKESKELLQRFFKKLRK